MLISKDLIVMPIAESTKEDVLEVMAEVAYKANKVSDKSMYIKAVLKREEEYSTAVGFNVAIPHGKTDAVIEPFLMYGRVNNVDWSALDGEPVKHVFLIGVPEKEAGNTHLQILAKLSRKLMKEDFRTELNHAESAEDLLQLLKNHELL